MVVAQHASQHHPVSRWTKPQEHRILTELASPTSTFPRPPLAAAHAAVPTLPRLGSFANFDSAVATASATAIAVSIADAIARLASPPPTASPPLSRSERSRTCSSLVLLAMLWLLHRMRPLLPITMLRRSDEPFMRLLIWPLRRSCDPHNAALRILSPVPMLRAAVISTVHEH